MFDGVKGVGGRRTSATKLDNFDSIFLDPVLDPCLLSGVCDVPTATRSDTFELIGCKAFELSKSPARPAKGPRSWENAKMRGSSDDCASMLPMPLPLLVNPSKLHGTCESNKVGASFQFSFASARPVRKLLLLLPTVLEQLVNTPSPVHGFLWVVINGGACVGCEVSEIKVVCRISVAVPIAQRVGLCNHAPIEPVLATVALAVVASAAAAPAAEVAPELPARSTLAFIVDWAEK